MQRSSRLDLLTIGLAYLGFIGLGLNAGLIGVAWPSMQAEFGVPLDAVGYLLLASTAGYLTASFFSGPLAYRFGMGRLLLIGGIAMTSALIVIAIAHTWLLLIAIMLISGIGSGLIDAGLNAYLAQHHGERAMNWLHASFGVGITISPLILTAIITADQSWRLGYWIVGAFIGVVALFYFATMGWWRSIVPDTGDQPARRISMRSTLRMPVVWMGILMFFLYAGLEATPGQWVFTYFTQARGIVEESAGLWVSIYWGSFTIGRIFFGAIITRLNTRMLLRVLMIAAIISAVLIWWNPVDWVGFIGLTVLGFAQAPMFPVLISNTPRRVGIEHAPNAIGFQVSGAGIGIAALPALAGVLANNISLEIIPPFIVTAAVLMIILYELSLMQAARTRPVTTPTT